MHILKEDKGLQSKKGHAKSIFLICLMLLLLMPLQSFSLAGDASDPLVSKSWVDSYVEITVSELEAQAKQLIVQAKALWQREIVLTPDSKTAYINQGAYQMDIVPKIVTVEGGGGVTLVPLRFLGETLNINVNWDGANNRIICSNGKKVVILPLNSNVATINGVETALQIAPMIENNRTLVPLRFISQAFDCQVVWDGAAKKIIVRNYFE